MSEPKAQQEPSMEEILASIRRIISEDGAGAAEAKAEPPAPARAPAADVLELTEVVEEPEESEEPAAEAEPVAEGEVELREDEPPDAAPEPEEPESPEPAAAAPAPEPERIIPAPPKASTTEGGLIGPAAAAASTSALANLVQAVDASRGGTPIGQGNRTIEDLVKEVMRPMIKDWLDANLPRLVERLVRKEIERLSKDAEGE